MSYLIHTICHGLHSVEVAQDVSHPVCQKLAGTTATETLVNKTDHSVVVQVADTSPQSLPRIQNEGINYDQ